jgi:hypothetical protein
MTSLYGYQWELGRKQRSPFINKAVPLSLRTLHGFKCPIAGFTLISEYWRECGYCSERDRIQWDADTAALELSKRCLAGGRWGSTACIPVKGLRLFVAEVEPVTLPFDYIESLWDKDVVRGYSMTLLEEVPVPKLIPGWRGKIAEITRASTHTVLKQYEMCAEELLSTLGYYDYIYDLFENPKWYETKLKEMEGVIA